jgi:hypothetical protein
MWRTLVSLVALSGVCSHAYAITECEGPVQSYFTDMGSAQGAQAKIWVVMPNGFQWYVLQTDTNSQNIMAGITTSVAAGIPITVRLQADNVACDSTSGVRTDVLGMWLASH